MCVYEYAYGIFNEHVCFKEWLIIMISRMSNNDLKFFFMYF